MNVIPFISSFVLTLWCLNKKKLRNSQKMENFFRAAIEFERMLGLLGQEAPIGERLQRRVFSDEEIAAQMRRGGGGRRG